MARSVVRRGAGDDNAPAEKVVTAMRVQRCMRQEDVVCSQVARQLAWHAHAAASSLAAEDCRGPLQGVTWGPAASWPPQPITEHGQPR